MIKNIQEIFETSIADFCSGYLKMELKRAGVGLVGLSPFTDEKTGSFRITPSRQLYNCFSSGNGGNNNITLLMQIKGLDFPSAAKEVASHFNIALEYDSDFTPEQKKEFAQKALKKQTIKNINHWAYEQYKSVCKGESFFAGRVTDKETIDRYSIVAATDDPKFLVNRAKGDKSIIAALKQAELVNAAGYDFFAYRDLIPFFKGKDIIGFTGRFRGLPKGVSSDFKQPKYKNSKETELFKKNEYLYGSQCNYDAIKKNGHVYLVEGNVDIPIFAQCGIKNLMSISGHTLSDAQADIIAKKFKDISISLIPDSDKAGYDSLPKNIDKLADRGIECKVHLLPKIASWIPKTKKTDFKGSDEKIQQQYDEAVKQEMNANPDKQFNHFEPIEDGYTWKKVDIEEHTSSEERREAFKLFTSAKDTTFNGVIYLCKRRLSEDDEVLKLPFYISKHLMRYESEGVQSYLIDLIAREIKGVKAPALKAEISKAKAARIIAESSNSSKPKEKKQAVDANEFGFYIDGNVMRFKNQIDDKNVRYDVKAHFNIKPIMHIINGEDVDFIFRLTSKTGQETLLKFSGSTFVNFKDFTERIEKMTLCTHSMTKAEFGNLKRWVYAQIPSSQAIEALGWQEEGFWAWANGVYVPTSDGGEFIATDENGQVEVNGQSYFIEAMSSIVEDEDKDQSSFIHTPLTEDFNEVEFWEKYTATFGDNATVTLSFLIASLFRDLFYDTSKYFPLLNFFGPAGSGKSTLGHVVSRFFGAAPMPSCAQTSEAAFCTFPAKAANAITIFEEFDNALPDSKHEFLKNFYDGFGKEGGRPNSIKTYRRDIVGTVILGGQQKPIKSALSQRVISLHFEEKKKQDITQEMYDNLEKLQILADTGMLTNIVHRILDMRSYFEKEIRQERKNARNWISENTNVTKSRVANNGAMLLSAYAIAEKYTKLPDTLDNLKEVMKETLERQDVESAANDDVSIFLGLLIALINKEVFEKEHFKIENRKVGDIEKFKETKEGRCPKSKDTIEKEYKKEVDILYLNLSKVMRLYHTFHRQSYGRNGLDKGSMKSYLKSAPGFIGFKNAKYFKGGNGEAVVLKNKVLEAHGFWFSPDSGADEKDNKPEEKVDWEKYETNTTKGLEKNANQIIKENDDLSGGAPF